MKTPKQKCKEMWLHFIRYPDDDKENYRQYLINKGRAGEYDECWACEESINQQKYAGDLKAPCTYYCPIIWPAGHCNTAASPFHTWLNARRAEDRKQAAIDMVKLIDDTWEE